MIWHVCLISISLNYHKTPLGLWQQYKLAQHCCHYDLRKYTFTNCVISIWNSLSDYVVSAETFNTFKRWLDKFWSDQDVSYNYKADFHGFGNCSITVNNIYVSLSNILLWHNFSDTDYRGLWGLLPFSTCDVMMKCRHTV